MNYSREIRQISEKHSPQPVKQLAEAETYSPNRGKKSELLIRASKMNTVSHQIRDSPNQGELSSESACLRKARIRSKPR